MARQMLLPCRLRQEAPKTATFLSRFAAVFALAMLITSAASACSCAQFLTNPKEALDKSALVFAGKVAVIEPVTLPQVMYIADENNNLIPGQYMVRRGLVTLNVTKQWKGRPTKSYVVLAAPESVKPFPAGGISPDCDVHFEVGKEYLVFTTDGYAEANACAPTGLLADRLHIVRELDVLAKLMSISKPSPPNG